jgi:hypothetical protein
MAGLTNSEDQMSFFKPYQTTIILLKSSVKATPHTARPSSPSALLLAGCSPAEPASSWG